MITLESKEEKLAFFKYDDGTIQRFFYAFQVPAGYFSWGSPMGGNGGIPIELKNIKSASLDDMIEAALNLNN